MPLLQLGESQPQEGVQFWVGFAAEVRSRQTGHLLIVDALAVRVDGISAPVAAEVAVELRTDVKQFVEQGDELVIKVLIEKPRQAEGDEIKKLPPLSEVTLDLIGDAPLLPGELAIAKSQGGDSGLQAMSPPATGLRHGEQQLGDVHMIERFTASHDICTESLDSAAKIKGLIQWPTR
jgi:hypothetical protein